MPGKTNIAVAGDLIMSNPNLTNRILRLPVAAVVGLLVAVLFVPLYATIGLIVGLGKIERASRRFVYRMNVRLGHAATQPIQRIDHSVPAQAA